MSPEGGRLLYLVAVDGSKPSEDALDFAVGLARKTAAMLEVMTVEDVTVLRAEAISGVAAPSAFEAAEEAARRLIENACARVAAAGLPCSSAVIPMWDPAAGIVKHAESVGASLVVVGSHGRTGIKRVLLGSVAEKVVRLAPCPVLVVR